MTMNKKMENNLPDCCQPKKESNGFLQGILFGILPHSFCIGFIVFSVIGVTAFSAIFRQLLLIPNFFEIMIGFSFVMATISAIIYLKRFKMLSLAGIKNKWQYLTILYSTVVIVNLVFLNFIFPRVANINTRQVASAQSNLSTAVLSVNIPCSGHAVLISDELKKIDGVTSVNYNSKGNFEVSFDSRKVTVDQILSAPIFKSYPASEVK